MLSLPIYRLRNSRGVEDVGRERGIFSLFAYQVGCSTPKGWRRGGRERGGIFILMPEEGLKYFFGALAHSVERWWRTTAFRPSRFFKACYSSRDV